MLAPGQLGSDLLRQFIQYFLCAGMRLATVSSEWSGSGCGSAYRPRYALASRFRHWSRLLKVRAGLMMVESQWLSSDDDSVGVAEETAALERDGQVRPVKTLSEIFADDAILIIRLTIILLKLFGFGWKWIINGLRLIAFVLLLLPAFAIMFGRYFLCSNIQRGIQYGIHGRSYLDVYQPTDAGLRPPTGWPVVIYFTGGAWIIGHRAWASIMGWEMARRGVMFVSVDYRNFPQGRIIDMLVDADNAITFVFDNIAAYGGDTDNITLCGQSAGAHIAAVAIIQQCKWAQVESRVAWRPARLRRFVGISGPYDLDAVCQHLHGRGLYRRVLRRIMGRSLALWSPTCVLNGHDHEKTPFSPLPSAVLFHGNADRTVPIASSIAFQDALQKVGVDVRLRIYPEKTHTDLILEDSISGYDPFLIELIALIRDEPVPNVVRRSWPMCFPWQIALARFINPF